MTDSKRPRKSQLRWVRIGDLRVSPKAQREFKKAHAEAIAAEFELEALGYPVVSLRGGHYWILDGQHRVEALKLVGFTDDDLIECECYEDLTEADEADLFLRRDTRRAVNKFDKFRIAVTAGHPRECHVERLVRAADCVISHNNAPYSIAAPDALLFVYQFGSTTLSRTIKTLAQAYAGDRAALRAPMIKGMGLVCQRYDGKLDDENTVSQLGKLSNSPAAIMRRAAALQLKTGHTQPHCVAAVIVEAINDGQPRAKKLESWWR